LPSASARFRRYVCFSNSLMRLLRLSGVCLVFVNLVFLITKELVFSYWLSIFPEVLRERKLHIFVRFWVFEWFDLLRYGREFRYFKYIFLWYVCPFNVTVELGLFMLLSCYLKLKFPVFIFISIVADIYFYCLLE